MINWEIEAPQIYEQSLLHGVDPLFIATIRKVENGDTIKKAYGVMNPKINTYPSQLQVCCATVRDRVVKFPENPLKNLYFGYGTRACYSSEFIQEFQIHWAPILVENDPNHLNENWLTNALNIYSAICARGSIG